MFSEYCENDVQYHEKQNKKQKCFYVECLSSVVVYAFLAYFSPIYYEGSVLVTFRRHYVSVLHVMGKAVWRGVTRNLRIVPLLAPLLQS